MLASLDEPPVAQRGLIYEPKYDGIRALVDLRPPARQDSPPTVALYSRNGNDKTAQFPAVVRALQAIGGAADGPCCSTAKSSPSTRRAGRWASSTSRAAST